MATKKLTRSEVNVELQLFIESNKKYDSYAYMCGYLQSMLADLIADMPKSKQESYVTDYLRRYTK